MGWQEIGVRARGHMWPILPPCGSVRIRTSPPPKSARNLSYGVRRPSDWIQGGREGWGFADNQRRGWVVAEGRVHVGAAVLHKHRPGGLRGRGAGDGYGHTVCGHIFHTFQRVLKTGRQARPSLNPKAPTPGKGGAVPAH